MPPIAVILGGASCLWEDVAALRELVDMRRCTIIAVNDAGIEWHGRLDHWASAHPEEFTMRMEKREANGHPGGYETWTRPCPRGLEHLRAVADHAVSERWMMGSSSLVAVGVAHATGHRRVVLCGAPMDERPHFNRADDWTGYNTYRAKWEELRGELTWVRSMSGWTAELLGTPDIQWLGTGEPQPIAPTQSEILALQDKIA